VPEYIYIASNKHMPGLLKIGFSRSPTERLLSLHTTGVPTPFDLVALFPVARGRACETAIHGALSQFRPDSRREFFAVSLSLAMELVMPLLGAYLPAPDESCSHFAEEQTAPLVQLDPEGHHIIHWVFTGRDHIRSRRDIHMIYKEEYRGDPVDQAIDRLLQQQLIAKLPRASGSQQFVITTKGLRYVFEFPEAEEP
jgi:T5orf172 domain-containing protein